MRRESTNRRGRGVRPFRWKEPALSTVTAPARFALFPLRVARTLSLTPHLVRITLTGESLTGFVNGGLDQRIKLLLPLAGQTEPLIPPGDGDFGWYHSWREMSPEVRPVLRTYTVRGRRREPDEIDIDIAVHGDAGPGSRWAVRAAPGDRVAVYGPAVEQAGGVEFTLPADPGWVLLAGDESALPAIAAILEELPEDLPVRVFAEVDGPGEEAYLSPGRAGVETVWIHRRDGAPGLTEAVRAAELPGGRPYAWIAGEAAGVRELRRHLVGERGMDRRAVCFMGYWRAGRTEDQRGEDGPEEEA
ncbi:siderophore-interacting protein [Kitasatospora sp. NPDC127067]|uniref:siderophore-interacting protein n=1 Tax=Kitasatospora sp. NPDC127067 TaxID=3347126 RepID=UPI00364E8768